MPVGTGNNTNKSSKRSSSERERRRKIRSKERNEKVVKWCEAVAMAAAKKEETDDENIKGSSSGDDYEYDEDYALADKPFMRTDTSLMTSFNPVFFEDEQSDAAEPALKVADDLKGIKGKKGSISFFFNHVPLFSSAYHKIFTRQNGNKKLFI
jgi:hypothetical protein